MSAWDARGGGPTPRSSRLPVWLRRLGRMARWPLATFLATTLPGAILVLGVVMESVRRSVERRWRRLRGGDGGRSEAVSSVSSRWLRTFVLGLQGLAASWLVTAPAVVLWAFAWHAGWNTSFQKVYEQAAVGPLLGLAGCLLFCLLAPPTVVAQARHAATGDWRTGVDLPFAWRLCLRRPVASVVLAGLYAVAALPLTLAVILPAFLGSQPFLEGKSDAELRDFLGWYILGVTAVGLFAFRGLRLVAGRLYADALHLCVIEGVVAVERLHPAERRALTGSGEVVAESGPGPGTLVSGSIGPGFSAARSAPPVLLRRARVMAGVLGLAVAGVLWFGLVAQVFVGAFAHDRGPGQWLHQPLLHAPWWDATPSALRGKGN